MNLKSPMTENHAQQLGQRTFQGGVFVFASMITQNLIALLILGLMARLLDPEAYGLLGMVFALIMFLQTFSDMGLPLATVQKAELTQAQISTMFWLNLGLGVLLGAVTAAVAPLVVRFYHEPVLLPVTLLCALNFPLAALGAQHRALLQRRMQFGRLAICEILGLSAGGGVGVFLALRGYGVFALVGQQLTFSATSVISYWVFAAWLPGRPRRGCGAGAMLRLGGFLTGFNFVNYFSRNLDKILLGRFQGASPLGLYTRGYTLMMFPIQMVSLPISSVMVPALSQIQHDLPRMRSVYLQVLQMIGFISFPLMVWLLICSHDVIAVIYGDKWLSAAPIFRILCIVGIWQGVYNATGQVFIATGRTDRQFKIGLFMALVLAVAFGLGVQWGAGGIAIAYAVAFSAAIIPYLSYTYKTINLRLAPVIRSLFPSLAAALTLIPVIGGFYRYLLPQESPVLRLLASFAVAMIWYFIISAVINRPFLLNIYHRILYHTAIFSITRNHSHDA